MVLSKIIPIYAPPQQDWSFQGHFASFYFRNKSNYWLFSWLSLACLLAFMLPSNPFNPQSSAMKHEFKDIKYAALAVTSAAFKANDFIPSLYTCDGKNINPPLRIDHIPDEAKSLALIVDDPDAPGGLWVHWVVWNIPVTHEIPENKIPGIEGLNDFKRHHYGGPCPPSGTHHYFFKIYALDTVLDIPEKTNKTDLEKAMQPHIVGFGEIIGLYKRKG